MMKKIVIFILLMVVLVPALRAQINTNRMMAVGRNALYFEDYVLSIQYFNRVIKVKPYLAEPYYYRGVAKFYLDDLGGAANDCDVALNINPFLIGAYNLRGIVRLRQGQSDLALEDFTAGLNIEPDNMSLWLNAGIAHINLKEYDKAEAACDSVMNYDSRSIAARLYKGIALVQSGDSIGALGQFVEATNINNYSADAFVYRGMMHYMLKNYAEALHDYDRLVELRPNDANILVNRAITKYNLDDYRGCLADLDEAIRIDPRNGMAYGNRGMIRAEIGETNKAIDDFSKVLALDGSDDIALMNRAACYQQVGEMNKALADLNIIIARHPDFGDAYYMRAAVKRSLNDISGSELDWMTAYTFEQERIKRGLANAEKTDEQMADEKEKKKKESRSKNDNDIRKYDQMAVVSDFTDNDDKLTEQGEMIRGRVQDRDIAIDLEPVFELNFFTTDTLLPKAHYYAASVEAFNASKIYSRQLFLTNREYTAEGEQAVGVFTEINNVSHRLEIERSNWQLYFLRGTLYNTVINYNNAINDYNVCLLKDPNDVNALFNRAATRFKMVEVIREMENEAVAATEVRLGQKAAEDMRTELSVLDYDLVAEDLQKVVELDPNFAFAYYNMSLVQAARKDFAAAEVSLDKAIELNSELAEAYFNRGIIRIYLGREEDGTKDLSRAGELGIVKAYNVIKRWTTTKPSNEQ